MILACKIDHKMRPSHLPTAGMRLVAIWTSIVGPLVGSLAPPISHYRGPSQSPYDPAIYHNLEDPDISGIFTDIEQRIGSAYPEIPMGPPIDRRDIGVRQSPSIPTVVPATPGWAGNNVFGTIVIGEAPSIPTFPQRPIGGAPVVVEPVVPIPAPVRSSPVSTGAGLPRITTSTTGNEMSIFSDVGSSILDSVKAGISAKVITEINRGLGRSDPRPTPLPRAPSIPGTPWDDWYNRGAQAIDNLRGIPMSTITEPALRQQVIPAGAASCGTGCDSPRYLTYDCKTGEFKPRKRRRRKKALTNSDMAALAFIQTLPNTQNVKTALARMIK